MDGTPYKINWGPSPASRARAKAKTITVKDLQDKDLTFLSDSQDVDYLNDYLNLVPDEFNAFFVKVQDCEFVEVYGMEGIVPGLHKQVWRVECPA